MGRYKMSIMGCSKLVQWFTPSDPTPLGQCKLKKYNWFELEECINYSTGQCHLPVSDWFRNGHVIQLLGLDTEDHWCFYYKNSFSFESPREPSSLSHWTGARLHKALIAAGSWLTAWEQESSHREWGCKGQQPSGEEKKMWSLLSLPILNPSYLWAYIT